MTNQTIYNKFKAEILKRRKARDPIAKAMQLVKTEADKVEYLTNARAPEDADLFKALKKTIAGLKEVLKHSSSDMPYEHSQVYLFEKYLPRMLSEKDLVVVISSIMAVKGVTCSADGIRSMGLVMSELKRLYPVQYDGKLASGIFKDIIS